jgi:hypothetical protein
MTAPNNRERNCSKTSVLEQQPSKKAVLQGFSLKNCKSQWLKPAKTNRVLEQART